VILADVESEDGSISLCPISEREALHPNLIFNPFYFLLLLLSCFDCC
jgi:hypothetical protein